MASLGIPAFGYGIRYDHGLFRQVIADGWQQRMPGGLAVVRQSLGVRAAGSRLPDRLRRHASSARATRRHRRATSGGRPRRVAGGRLRHADRRLARAARQHAAALVGPRAPIPSLDDFNRGDHVGALADAGPRRGDLARPLPERRHAGRPGAAPAPGILLRLGVAAGPRPPPSRSSTASSRRLPITRRSSSTTRIRPSPSPS